LLFFFEIINTISLVVVYEKTRHFYLIRVEENAIATFFQEPTLDEEFLSFLGFLQLLLLLELR